MANKVSDYLEDYRRYDQYVDLVSIFESLLTKASDFSETVKHFERFPTVTAPDENPARPDFTVVFNDGTGLAGEIASIAPHPESLDSACKQLGRYDTLTELPINSSGYCQPVAHVDVLLLTHHENDRTVARRIFGCIADSDHPYKPSAPPLIASFDLSANENPHRYVISKLPYPENGHLREGHRQPAMGKRLEERNLISSAELFTPTKVARIFMNDPIDTLYLATHLWFRLFSEISPTHSSTPNPMYLTTAQITEMLQERYDRGSRTDVEKAMRHLQQARLCDLEPDGKTWLIAWHQLRNAPGQHDAAARIASRIAKPPSKGAVLRVRESRVEESALSLF